MENLKVEGNVTLFIYDYMTHTPSNNKNVVGVKGVQNLKIVVFVSL